MTHDFKTRLKKREILLGPLVTLSSTEVAEILSRVGFDWLWIEMEHAPTGLARIQELIQATGGRIPCLVRVPWNDDVWIKQILDTGCDGIVIPQIRNSSEARAAVRACKYPPVGIRSVGIARAQGYGMSFQDYIEHADERLVTVLQTEHIDAANNIESILDVPGFDAVLIGPYDLSASMGIPGQINHPDVQQAIGKIKAACSDRQMPIGVFAIDAEAAKGQIATGCTLIALSADTMFLWKAAKQAIVDVGMVSG
jgi:2-keto-3-deoxy-L-rhamnonate aldolase RhmA